MIVDDLLAGRESQTRAPLARCVWSSLGRKKTIEDLWQNILGDSRTVVPNRQYHRVGLGLMLDHNADRSILLDRLPSVRDEVQQEALKLTRRAEHHRYA